jgi:phosphate-selective porin OprO/OprP
MGAAVLPAQANNDAMMDLLQVLRDKGTISNEDYQLLTNAAAADKEKSEAEKEEMVSIVKDVEKNSPKVTLDSKGLNFESSDKAFTANIGGRIHADYGFVNDDFFGADNTGISEEFGNGSQFRRARIGMEGTMFTDWFYGLEINYGGSDGSTGFTDAVIGYKGFDNAKITLGRHKMPAGLEELTSSNRISTLERSMATNTFALGRFNGLSVETKGTNWTATGGTWMGEGDGDIDNSGKDSDWGVAGRFTFAPVQEKNSVIHLGASVSYLDFEKEGSSFQDVRVRQRVNRFATERPVQVRYNDTESANTYGLELATIQGPFSLQGEYFYRTLNRNDFKDADLDGWYVLGTFTLTGETRGYKEGKMRTISPKNPVGKGGFGAWELVARYDELDIWDSSAASPAGSVTDLRGTKSENWTIGVNWYVNDNIRFMANYVDSDIKDSSPNDNTGDIKALVLRGQVAF